MTSKSELLARLRGGTDLTKTISLRDGTEIEIRSLNQAEVDEANGIQLRGQMMNVAPSPDDPTRPQAEFAFDLGQQAQAQAERNRFVVACGLSTKTDDWSPSEVKDFHPENFKLLLDSIEEFTGRDAFASVKDLTKGGGVAAAGRFRGNAGSASASRVASGGDPVGDDPEPVDADADDVPAGRAQASSG